MILWIGIWYLSNNNRSIYSTTAHNFDIFIDVEAYCWYLIRMTYFGCPDLSRSVRVPLLHLYKRAATHCDAKRSIYIYIVDKVIRYIYIYTCICIVHGKNMSPACWAQFPQDPSSVYMLHASNFLHGPGLYRNSTRFEEVNFRTSTRTRNPQLTIQSHPCWYPWLGKIQVSYTPKVKHGRWKVTFPKGQ